MIDNNNEIIQTKSKNKVLPVMLYIEDDPQSARLVAKALRRICEVMVAIDANEGFHMLQHIRPQPDIVMTDLNLPGLTGADVVVKLSDDTGYKNPIITTTAQDVGDQLLLLGSDAHIPKPIDIELLQTTVRNLLSSGKVIRKKAGTGELREIEAVRQHSTNLVDRLREKIADLESINKELLQTDKVKADLLSIIGHELRTPVTLVVGYIHMLLGQSEGVPEQLAEELLKAVQRLEVVVEETMLTSRLYSKTQDVNKQSHDWVELVASCVETAQKLSSRNRRNVKINITEESPEHLYCFTDEYLTKQVIMALLSNAVKYTDDGGEVLVDIHLKDDVLFTSITDQGPGVADPEKLISRTISIEHDTMLHSTGKWKHKGNGLGVGVPISNKIAGLMGGELQCSNLEGGCQFRLVLPQKKLD